LRCNTIGENTKSHHGNVTSVTITHEAKQRGAHVFSHINEKGLEEFRGLNLEWITLVPWGFQKKYDTESVSFGQDRKDYLLSRDSSWSHQIQLAHEAGYKVFLKPHIWMHEAPEDKWRSDIYPSNDENWTTWKESYSQFILMYAEIAERNEVELFCIGAEMTRLTLEKKEYWIDLIKQIREVYKGEITYAANWYKEYESIAFWSQLDYIGIQAYFPLADSDYPNLKTIERSWKKIIPTLEENSRINNKPILFTELGYKSTSDSAKEPWKWIDYESDTNAPISYETQTNCYQAFFNTVWNQDWFAGIHIWQIRDDYTERDQIENDFTPQGKPAQEIIKKGFSLR